MESQPPFPPRQPEGGAKPPQTAVPFIPGQTAPPFNLGQTTSPFGHGQAGNPFGPNPNAAAAFPPQESSGPSLSLGDVYYVLFRHKWKILLCTALGIAAAATYYVNYPPPYQSDAKLFVRYVLAESKVVDPTGESAQVKSPDMRGETIMESETEILTSLDLSKQVAAAIGPDRILAKLNGGNDPMQAAAVINRGLLVEVPRRSSVIHVRFQHPDPEVVQPVLSEIVNRYLQTHVEIHRAVGLIGGFLAQETDQLRARLAQTEEELRRARNRAGVISLADSKKEFAEQMARLREELLDAQAQYAERSAVIKELAGQVAPPSTEETTEAPAPTPTAKSNEHRWLLTRLDLLRRREQEMLAQFTPENSRVVEVQTQIADAEGKKRALEDEFPALARTAAPTQIAGPGAIDLQAESARVNALQARIKILAEQLDKVKADAAAVDQVEGAISELLRRKELEEANYRYYAARLEQARINEALGTGKVSNISQIQTPSPPQRDRAESTKIAGGLLGAGLALGLAWAFAIEMFLDRSVRRPADLERTLGLPLFLTIPAIGRNGRKPKSIAPPPPEPAKEVGADSPTSTAVDTVKAPPPPALAEELRSFHETLRDRLIAFFESRNLTHKPKLVAVTGLDRGSGVTTIAAGLASCLSETGEGNVLVVDMTPGKGSAQQFHRGKEVRGLEQILSSRDDAQVQENLYVVTEEPTQDRLSRILPQRFNKLVPKLKASNFDYIIFDMPTVSQISITPRLAGFMDMVLLVVESEKTDRDLVQRATALLTQTKPFVGTILNKNKPYVPKRLHRETLGDL